VAWDWIRLGGSAATAAAAPRATGARQLAVPLGAQIDYYLDLSPGSAFAGQRLRATGGRATLEVSFAADGGEELQLARLAPRDAPWSVSLPVAAAVRGRLSLRTVEDGDGPASGELVIDRPAILGPAATPASGPGRLAAAGVGAAPAGAPRAVDRGDEAERRPHIVLYLVDTLRADRLGAYGGRRGLSPRLDAFAARATLYENAVAQSSWTKASVASIFTGLGPRQHGVNEVDDGLPPDLPLLAERLRAAGYRTAGFAANAYLDEASGFQRGFADFTLVADGDNLSDEVHRRVVAWLDREGSGAPLFLYVHTIDPHAPYAPPPEYRRRFAPEARRAAIGSVHFLRRLAARTLPLTAATLADLEALYDAEVAFNDHHFGLLLDELRRRGLYDDALIAFLSDHGEEFHEHGLIGHGAGLYREVLQVPLVVKRPRQAAGERVSQPAQHVDLLPTLLAAAALEVPAGLPGADLAAPVPERAILSYLRYDGREGASVLFDGWHSIMPLNRRFGERSELFDWRADRREGTDLGAARPVPAGYLRSLLRRELLAPVGPLRPTRLRFDAEERRRLRALGYLGP
jgi:choline-sulfatase